jgi:hypothetical protein
MLRMLSMALFYIYFLFKTDDSVLKISKVKWQMPASMNRVAALPGYRLSR